MSALVSILMPAKNAAAFIKDSIESILNQSYTNLELIIINDRSTDNTAEIIETFNDLRICVIDGPGTGISDAFNAGLAVAKGEYLCRCDSDDLYPLDRITDQVSWLDKHSDYIAVCGMFSSIDSKGRHLVQYNKDTVSTNLNEKFSDGIVVTHFCTFMTRTEVLRKIHGCRSFFVTAEDIDLQFRLSEQGSIYFIAKNMYLYRLHEASITHSQANERRIFYEQTARDYHQQRVKNGMDDLQRGKVPDPPVLAIGTNSAVNQIKGQLISESWYWHKKKQKLKAIAGAFKVIKFYPLSLRSWRNFVVIILKVR